MEECNKCAKCTSALARVSLLLVFAVHAITGIIWLYNPLGARIYGTDPLYYTIVYAFLVLLGALVWSLHKPADFLALQLAVIINAILIALQVFLVFNYHRTLWFVVANIHVHLLTTAIFLCKLLRMSQAKAATGEQVCMGSVLAEFLLEMPSNCEKNEIKPVQVDKESVPEIAGFTAVSLESNGNLSQNGKC